MLTAPFVHLGRRCLGRCTRPVCVFGPSSNYSDSMCRNIRPLYNFDPPATDEEVRAAARQYVRKISGFSKPSRANEPAFERAVAAVAATSSQLLSELDTVAPPKSREAEAAKARARAVGRYAA